MLRKIIDWESLRIIQKNFHNGVSFIKVTSLQLYHKEISPQKTSCLENNILRKNYDGQAS